MAKDRTSQALARITAAAKRIEGAAVRPDAATTTGDPELEQRYEALRSAAAVALRDLDRLIESLEP